MNDFLCEDGQAYLTRVVIDVSSRVFRMYSSDGDTRTVGCDTTQEFMNILEFVRDFQESGLLDEDVVVYSEPNVTV